MIHHMPGYDAATKVIGYCSGGRQPVLAAVSLPLDAAVDCYGAFVVGSPPEGWSDPRPRACR
jgi:carboxymethylenebutenolidase